MINAKDKCLLIGKKVFIIHMAELNVGKVLHAYNKIIKVGYWLANQN